jgi:hypothetical protein
MYKRVSMEDEDWQWPQIAGRGHAWTLAVMPATQSAFFGGIPR